MVVKPAAERTLAFAAAAALALASSMFVEAQQEYRYTEQAGGGNEFVLGYPPPVPVDSTIPVDGFRSYAALHARHQDLMLQSDIVTGAVAGQTLQGREIWVYALGDDNAETVNAGPESSVLVNGGIHAREWGAPELTTALIEAMVERAGDNHIYDYLADNVHFSVLPVNNIDGFVQTQRYPAQVLVGADPGVPQSWPRDGRMRRKNMRGVDAVLSTLTDHLRGIDLNRNNEPFWAASGASSPNPNDLAYHGSSSFSEPETRALMAAAELAREDRLRWYEDVHSYTQVVFSVSTFNARRNAIQSELLSSFDRFHNALSLQRHGTSRRYPEDLSPVGSGIGVTAEYFGYTYEIPAWTLEIEPRRGAVDYGGLGAEHDGFILPDAEVARLRRDMTLTHAVLAYRQAGPPSITALKIRSASGWVVQSARGFTPATVVAFWRASSSNRCCRDSSTPFRLRSTSRCAGPAPKVRPLRPVTKMCRSSPGSCCARQTAWPRSSIPQRDAGRDIRKAVKPSIATATTPSRRALLPQSIQV